MSQSHRHRGRDQTRATKIIYIKLVRMMNDTFLAVVGNCSRKTRFSAVLGRLSLTGAEQPSPLQREKYFQLIHLGHLLVLDFTIKHYF